MGYVLLQKPKSAMQGPRKVVSICLSQLGQKLRRSLVIIRVFSKRWMDKKVEQW